MQIPVYNTDGGEVGQLEVNERDLGGEIRHALLKQAYVMYHANKRHGAATTKGRGDVEGSTRKLYRQKGTGRARRGAVRTNVMRGGGVAFAKKPKSWRQKMPRKMRQLATRNALLAKALDREIKVVDSFGFDTPKTKQMSDLLGTLNINRTCLLALDPADTNTALAARNVSDITSIEVNQINAYDLLSRRFLLVEKDAFVSYLASKGIQVGGA